MSALFYKELRLLWSVWITTMLLVVAPTALVRLFHYDQETTVQLTLCVGILGCAILGVAGFGWEFESRTFSLLLAQPRQRSQFWRAKIGALVVALLPLGLALAAVSLIHLQDTKLGKASTEVLLVFTLVVAVITSGLWTTLLLRQIFGSIVFSIIAPTALLASVMALFDQRVSDALQIKLTISALIAYSVAGYFLARWLFRTAQDTQWTGGNLSLSNVARRLRWTPAATGPKQTHPLRALLSKELHLHESSLLVAGLLLLLQLATLLLSWLAKNPEASVLGALPQMIWMLWLLMPALIGCSAVADERKLGTIEPQLCLPVSRSRQFLVKAGVAMFYGLALGAIVPILTSPLVRIREPQLPEFLCGWALACLGITIIGFYASSLARQMLQALGVAIAFVAVWAFLLNWLNGEFAQRGGYFLLFGHELWRGALASLIAPLVMLLLAMGHTWRRFRWIWLVFIALFSLALYLGTIQSFFDRIFNERPPTHWEKLAFMTLIIMSFALGPALLMLALAGKNFKHVQTAKSLWLRNAVTWAASVPLIIAITALVYNRAWDFGKQLEPPAGTPRLSGTVRPVITTSSEDSPNFVLLPDGRLSSYKGLERISSTIVRTDSNQPDRYAPNLRATENPRRQFIGGSNWLAIAKTDFELIGIKSDGSLWKVHWLEWVAPAGDVSRAHTGAPRPRGATSRQTSMKLERIGGESDWIAVAAGPTHVTVLKRDRTIWGWGNNSHQQLGEGPKAFTNGPVRIGNESDWINVFAGRDCSFGVKRDGSIWKWGARAQQSRENTVERNPVKLDIEVKGVRAILTSENGNSDYELILDEAGNLWGVGNVPWHMLGPDARRAGYKRGITWRLPGPAWTAIAAGEQRGVAGVKADGTLWDQDADDLRYDPYHYPTAWHREFGRRTDWIAVAIEGDSVLALAKDGTLCRFGDAFKPRPWSELLAPIRRVTWSINLLDAAP